MVRSLAFLTLYWAIPWLIFTGLDLVGGQATPQARAATPQADLVITSVQAQPAAQKTDVVTVVKNQGDEPAVGFNVYLYLDPAAAPPTSTTPATSFLLFDVPLAPQGVFTWTHSTAALAEPAPQIYAWVDPPWEQRVAESNDHNNLFPQAQPAITHITPQRAAPGATLTVTIAATNSHFTADLTTVDFGRGISVTQSTVVSPTQVAARIAIPANVPTATHTITVTTASERLVAPDAFRVDIISGTATLHGIVDLIGRPAKPHSAWAISLTVELQPAAGGTPQSELISSDQQGHFALSDIPPGAYRLRVKGNHTLANQIEEVVLHGGVNEIYLGTLIEGDVETNQTRNQVVVADFSQLSGAFDSCAGDARFLPNADLNESDDCVTIEDAALLIMHFNTQGDLRFPSPDRVPAPIPLRVSNATLAFTATQVVAPISATVALPLYVDPLGGDEVIGVTAHYTFNPTLLEVVALTVTEKLPQTLVKPVIDNQAGSIRLSCATRSGQAIDQRQIVALVQVRLKTSTTGASLLPLLGAPRATNLAGPNGSVLASARGITLISSDQRINLPERIYLPLAVK